MLQHPQTQSYLVAVGLVLVGLFGLVVVWKITKSLIKLAFWLVALGAVACLAWWLLAKEGVLPPPPFFSPPPTAAPASADPLVA
ncbi:MAG TPA: hypothetical protein VMB21_06660 [Candidatus Limnocylindria bacterium]|jgi:hypothetical protein|nr:hypothetical protein [Candidatus Limnocylindria bacterium]